VIAPVLPPSIGMIIFGVVANVSIGKLFMAAIVPGLLMGASLLVAWMIVARKDDVAVLPRMPMRERAKVAVNSTWALVMPVGIVGGMKFGVFTPTEAAVVAAVYAFLVGMFVYRELRWNAIYPLIVSAAKTTAVVVFLIACALVSGWLITASDIPQQVSELLQPFVDSPILLMAIMMLLVVIVGTALDFAPTLLILTPVLMPLVREAGIDPVYFGVLFIMNNAIGLITPPVGIVLNVVCGTAKLSMGELMKGIMPFLLAEVAVLFLLVLFPSIVLVPLRWLTG
jgi:TRAP-type transport system large permease protein